MSIDPLIQRLTQARELVGLSKTDLANQIGVSVAAVAQWESGTKSPTVENIAALAKVLNVSPAFFTNTRPLETSLGLVTFRAWKTAQTRRTNRKAQRYAELASEIFVWLAKAVKFPEPNLPEITVGTSPLEAASICRRHWGLGDRPILKLGELIESKGIVLCPAEFEDERFDAFSCVVAAHPFIFLGCEKQDRARSRFDAAHELGHLILHQHLSEEDLQDDGIHSAVENEANMFAGAFLLPEQSFSRDVWDSSLNGFLKLKAKWAVSAQAMIHRANLLGLITPNDYQRLQRRISAQGWRKAKGEQMDDQLPAIIPSLWKRSLTALSEGDVVKPWELPSSLPLPGSVLRIIFGTDLDDTMPQELSNILPFPVV